MECFCLLSTLLFLLLVSPSFSDTNSISFTKDTYLSSYNGNSNYGSETLVYLYNSVNVLLEMNLSPIASKCPTSAVLRLYIQTSPSDVIGRTVNVTHIQANWSEANVTYNNFKEVAYSSIQAQLQAKGSYWYELTVNNSMILKAIKTENSQVFIFTIFFSLFSCHL